eukprot:TRINITY_DN6646_c0_g1_i1.p1 TRINITY_DN6646_c0_g1~~TRINITY_DN6646_c0_g1_i1.p1  ORF type:complete len:564 (+),score=204.56 TRINITY_DN6646_c0_g1_i1:49-1692(+)
MQSAEIKELYQQKTGSPPGPAVSKFIDQLKVREVAKIWSAMGEGEDFIGAIKRIIGDQIRKAGGGEEVDDLDLDANLAKLEELKVQQEREKEERAAAKAAERVRLAAEKERLEKEKVERAAREAAEKAAAEAEAKKQQERAEKEAKEAVIREEAARKAEAEARAAEEAAAKAIAEADEAARQRESADQAEAEAAARRMAEAKAMKEAAEAAEKEAKARAAAEKAAAQAAQERAEALNEAQAMMQEVLAQQARERAEEEKKRAEEEAAEAERLAELEKAAAEEEDEEPEEEEEEPVTEEAKEAHAEKQDSMSLPVTIKLKDKDEQVGIHGLIAIGGRVRAIELISGGACERAGVVAASVIKEVHGHVITSKDDLIDAVKAVRAEGLTEFQMVTEPPLTKEELNQDMEKIREDRKRKAKEQVNNAMNTAAQLIIDLCLVGCKDLIPGSSKSTYAEVKLRSVGSDGTVGSDHPNPQKSTTKVVKDLSPQYALLCFLPPLILLTLSQSLIILTNSFDHKVRLVVPPSDCIRVSLFGQKVCQTLLKIVLPVE